MKFVHITFRFQYAENIDKLLDKHGVADYVRYPMVQGRDSDGKHFASKVFPGNITTIQAIIPDDIVDGFLQDLSTFRNAKAARNHLRAVVLPIENSVGFSG